MENQKTGARIKSDNIIKEYNQKLKMNGDREYRNAKLKYGKRLNEMVSLNAR